MSAGVGGVTRKTSAGKAQRRMQVAQRRRVVALLLRSGLEQQQIAEELAVSEATVSGDVAALGKQLQDETIADVEEMVREEMSALAGDEAYWRGELERANTGFQRVRAYEQVVTIMRRRAALLGLDAQQRRLSTVAAQGSPSAALDELLASIAEVGQEDGEGSRSAVGPPGGA